VDVRLFRVILPVSDVDQAAAFYGRLLGFPGERIAPNRHYFDCGGTILALVDPSGHHGAFRPNPDHVYFAVDDLEAAFDRARDAGCGELEPAIAVRVWGERSFYARDPFGNPLCFVDAATTYTGGPWGEARATSH
jgi:catechol 2,3-dioxygenase-like lactoylglutathione lyase family enzyme